jgi:hypothetical protein
MNGTMQARRRGRLRLAGVHSVAVPDLDAEATLKADSEELRQIIALRPAASRPQTAPRNATQALMLAVLEGGIRDYLGPGGVVRAEAEHWMQSEKRWPFAFPVMCETLGLESSTLRTALRALRARSAGPKDIGRSRPNAGYVRRLRA